MRIFFFLLLVGSLSLFSDETSDSKKLSDEEKLSELCKSKKNEDDCLAKSCCSWFPPDDPKGECKGKVKKGTKEKVKFNECKSKK